MRSNQRKPSVRKKTTRRARARGGGYGAGPQSGGRIPRAAFFTSVPGIVLIVVVAALVVVVFIAANKAEEAGLTDDPVMGQIDGEDVYGRLSVPGRRRLTAEEGNQREHMEQRLAILRSPATRKAAAWGYVPAEPGLLSPT